MTDVTGGSIRVRHPHLGEGVVLRILSDREWFIGFSATLKLRCLRAVLEVLPADGREAGGDASPTTAAKEAGSPPEAVVPAVTMTPMRQSRLPPGRREGGFPDIETGPIVESSSVRPVVLARRALASLRFGQVPVDAIDRLTMGLERVRELVLAGLEHTRQGRRPAPVVVRGPWGTGKTHSLAYVRSLAIRAGFWTSSVEIDADVNFGRPKPLYAAIVRNLRDPRGRHVVGAGGVIDLAMQHRCRNVLHADRISSVMDLYHRVGDEAGDTSFRLGEYLSADRPRTRLRVPESAVRGVRKFFSQSRTLYADRLAELLAEWAWFLRSIEVARGPRGASGGLVVLIDEMELNRRHCTTRNDLAMARDVVSQLLSREGPGTDAPLFLVMGTVELQDALLDQTGVQAINLEPPSTAGLRTIEDAVTALYQKAYPADIEGGKNPSTAEMPGGIIENIRDYIRRRIFHMDDLATTAPGDRGDW